MGEPFLASPLQTLLDKLDPLLDSDLQERFISQLKTWRSKLRQFRHVLSDAEERQIRDREVKKWLDKLRDLAYNADDVLEELRHEALQRQNNSSSDSAAISSQLQDLPAQIQGITKSFSDIGREKRDLRLKERHGIKSNGPKLNSNETTSLVDSSQIVGREKDVEAILKLLPIGETNKAEENRNQVFGMGGCPSSSSNNRGKFEQLKADRSETLVIPIVGMGGVGKTTLAQCIYNHNTVKNAFDLRAWVCVSDNFDIFRVTKALLCRVTEEDTINVDDLNGLQERLMENISRKRFLIVLDDIWNEDDEKWEKLFIPLKFGRPGSAVIVTTRSSKVSSITGSTSSKVASIMGSTSNYQLDLLEDDECLSILARHALGAQNFDAHPKLKDIGQKMLRRCDGLPLAAKILGGLLRDQDQDQAKWEEVYGSSLRDDSIREKIALVLGLSFNYLPSHLKQCFAYCSIFPKDYEFDEEDLILRWMAEGFLGEPNEEKQMEEGHKYFHLLLSRSLLQWSNHNSTKFVMHDLIHDLAQTVAGRVCSRIEKKEAEVVDIEAIRHLSFCRIFGRSKFEVLKNTKRLRTLLALTYFMNKKLLHNSLPQLRYLRVLSLDSYQIDELPNSVGDLKYLRYLNLSYSGIRFLPESLCGLYSLQSLILKGCRHLKQLPLRLKDLANLRYLDISGTSGLQELPPQVLDLKFFRKLTKFVVGERDGVLGLKGLENVHHLPGSLTISRLGEGQDIEDALVINLMNKKNIEELKFEWRRNFYNTEHAENEVQILNLLEPRKMLRNLEIVGYSGVTLPNWISDSSYSKLVGLSLVNCKRCKLLPSLGQLPLLQKLTIKGMSEIETIGTELYGEASPHAQPFPSLTELHIENCKNLRTLPDGIMSSNSNLQVLEIRACESLESFPRGVLPSTLKKLSIDNCRKLESIREMLIGPTSLDYVYFEKYPNLKSLPECLCTNLTSLRIDRCESIEAFPETGLPSPNLTYLAICYCKNLKYLPCNLRELTSLRDLCVAGCDNLVSLPEGGLPPSLQRLVFGPCAKVEKQMWDEWAPHKLPFLTSLSIYGGFRDVVCFPFPAQESEPLLPPSLTSLLIDGFPNLKSLSSAAFQNLTSLARLEIWDCPKLQSLPIEALSPSLGLLWIVRCPELKPKCKEGGEYCSRLSLIPNVLMEGRTSVTRKF